MVAYAVAAANEPTTAHITATDRSAGVEGTGLNIPPATRMELEWSGELAGASFPWCPNGKCETMKLGRAMNMTPLNAMTPAHISVTVNGS